MSLFNARSSNTKISTRLTLGFAALLGLLILLTAVGIYQVNQIDRDLTTINDVNGTKQRFAVDWRGSVHDRAIVLRDIVITAGNGNLSSLESEMERLRNAYSTATTGMEQVTSEYAGTAQEQSIINSINDQPYSPGN